MDARPHHRHAPLGEIALALSGGGYRAAAFHLGTIDLLQRLDLLRDVTILSTVSGGSISGASYAAALSVFNIDHFGDASPEPHPDDYEVFRASPIGYRHWYQTYFEFLNDVNVVEESALLFEEMLGKGTEKTPKLITAAAEVYERRLLGGLKMGHLLDDPRNHLREIAFNATDFRAGLGFRFQKTATRGVSGSFAHRIPTSVLREVRLADAVAASSCFPGAFEPIAFPDDFIFDDLEKCREELNEGHPEKPFERPVPVMDGGVSDNQGIQSLLNAVNRKNAVVPGLVLVSDTDVYDYEIYRFPQQPVGWLNCLTRWFSVSEAVRGGTMLVMLFLAWAAWLAGSTTETFSATTYLCCVAIPLVLWSILAVLPLAGWDFVIGEAQKGVDDVATGHKIDVEAWVGQFSFGQLREALAWRTGSLLSLAQGVYLKQIRSRVYEQLFAQKELKGTIVVNLIHELRKKKPHDQPEQWPQCSGPLLGVVDRAAKMATTLWFDPDASPTIRDVVAAGHICGLFNMLEQFDKLHKLAHDTDDEAQARAQLDELMIEVRTAPRADALSIETLAKLAQLRERLAEYETARLRWRSINDSLYPRALKLWQQLLQNPFALVDRPFDCSDAEFQSGEEVAEESPVILSMPKRRAA